MMNYGNRYQRYVFGLEQINMAVQESPIQFIEHVEEMFKTQLRDTAKYICNRAKQCRVILMAGPSSSGKTTAAALLRKDLEQKGLKIINISLDDFYLGHKRAPVLSNGQKNYEAVEALNIPEVKRCLSDLVNHGYCDMPTYNFSISEPNKEKTHVELPENGIALIEGIHALNPVFTRSIPEEGVVKIYISVKQGIKGIGGLVLSHRDIRFVRRIVRDFIYRKTPCLETVSMWKNVCRGEFLYIRPFKYMSDLTINSIHLYEPCVLRQLAIPLLQEIPKESEHYAYCQKICKSLERFLPIEVCDVPNDSLLREFVDFQSCVEN